jgi:magnesium transporter
MEQEESSAIVDCGVYVDGARLPGAYNPRSVVDKVRQFGKEFVWLGLHEPDHKQMQAVADVFGLHPLAVEDAVHAHQRPKLERYDDTLFLVLKTVHYVPHEAVSLAREFVETGEIMVFAAPDFVITFAHSEFGGLQLWHAAAFHAGHGNRRVSVNLSHREKE